MNNNIIGRILLPLFMLLAAAYPAKAETSPEVITMISDSYAQWENVEFSGKLRLDKLPISPTVKIFMQRDSLIQISLRAPILGEVGRIELTPDHLRAYNKMKKVYSEEPTQNLLDLYPDLVGDVQNLLLARVVVLSRGLLSPEMAGSVDVVKDEEGSWILLPEPPGGLMDFSYGYVVSPAARTQAFIGNLPRIADLELLYSYPGRGMQIDVDALVKGKHTYATLEFSTVKWGGTPMAPVNTSKYTRKKLTDFIKSF
ncbi:MAG: DUF4292 domain-containing protein [Muribaculaceae bacterium]|nr:DUF4292 domain-containing protein [Muribaculaceae bacterium]